MAIMDNDPNENAGYRGFFEVTTAGVNLDHHYNEHRDAINGKDWTTSMADGCAISEPTRPYLDSNAVDIYTIVNQRNGQWELVLLSRFNDNTYVNGLAQSGATVSGTVAVVSSHGSPNDDGRYCIIGYEVIERLREKSVKVAKCLVFALVLTAAPVGGIHHNPTDKVQAIREAEVEYCHESHVHEEIEDSELTKVIYEVTASGTFYLDEVIDKVSGLNT
ncbi:MAG: hypothetical protein ABIK83_01680 [Candidatus Zixiibacteriota bacterium]